MKFSILKIYIISFLFILLTADQSALARDSKIQYKGENISNYFLGIISINQDYNKAFKYLKKVQSLKNIHSTYNIEFIKTLILLNKFEEAFEFSRSIWSSDEFIFEVDLLLGLESFVKKDFANAHMYFERINQIYQDNIFFENFIGNILLTWNKASEGNKQDSFDLLENAPIRYFPLIKTQESFLNCYFNEDVTQESFNELIQNNEYNFSRYNFFLANYFLHNNKIFEAKKIIGDAREKYNSNLLIKQTEEFLLNNENYKIKNIFNCQSSQDVLAEIFYIIGNFYSSEKDYQTSNFYLNISFFLNNKFLPNQALLAENFYYQNKNKLSKNIYYSLKNLGSTYSWHASKNIASILIEEKGKKFSVKSLENDLNLLKNPDFENYYEIANFYKENQYFEKSVKYYSLALEKIKKDHFLFPKILDRRGTSFERLGDWEKAEKDLMQSLSILPDQPYVLNYLAYTWIDKGINLDKGLDMLKKAAKLRENDGYIIDSLGWAYFAKENYFQAAQFLQKAVELLPADPVINDHYADALWMLNKNIQARYVWKYVLNLDSAEEKLKKEINKKLIFGIN